MSQSCPPAFVTMTTPTPLEFPHQIPNLPMTRSVMDTTSPFARVWRPISLHRGRFRLSTARPSLSRFCEAASKFQPTKEGGTTKVGGVRIEPLFLPLSPFIVKILIQSLTSATFARDNQASNVGEHVYKPPCIFRFSSWAPSKPQLCFEF